LLQKRAVERPVLQRQTLNHAVLQPAKVLLRKGVEGMSIAQRMVVHQEHLSAAEALKAHTKQAGAWQPTAHHSGEASELVDSLYGRAAKIYGRLEHKVRAVGRPYEQRIAAANAAAFS
jgi:hypothetical protein